MSVTDNIVDRRVFVGGLLPNCSTEVLDQYFGQFGTIEDSNIVLDKRTGNSKGYGFVTYTDQAAAIAAVVDGTPTIDGKICNCNLASMGVVTANIPEKSKRSWSAANSQKNPNNSRIKKDQGWGIKRQRINTPRTPSYVQRLSLQGITITTVSAIEHIDTTKKINPPDAFKYFLEVSDLFRGNPEFGYYSKTLLEMAKKFRQTGEIIEVEPYQPAPRLSESKSDDMHNQDGMDQGYGGFQDGMDQQGYGGYQQGNYGDQDGMDQQGYGGYQQGNYDPNLQGNYDPNTQGNYDPNTQGNYDPNTQGNYDQNTQGNYDAQNTEGNYGQEGMDQGYEGYQQENYENQDVGENQDLGENPDLGENQGD